MSSTEKQFLSCMFFIILFTFSFVLTLVSYAKPKIIEPTLEVLATYFPTPATLRCLNHSGIPMAFHKAVISKRVKIPGQNPLEQNVTIGVKGKNKFVITGNSLKGNEIVLLKISPDMIFGLNTKGQSIGWLFGLENILGLQKKIHIKDKVDGVSLDYETFLRTSKGKIGNLNYKLDLFGQDKSINGETKYFLSGRGMLGPFDLTVNARDLEKNYYEINEQFGPVQAYTTVRVYD